MILAHNPCHGCADRRPGSPDRPSCHADCERRAAWLAQQAAEKAAVKAAKDAERPALEFIGDGHRKAVKAMRKHRGEHRR